MGPPSDDRDYLRFVGDMHFKSVIVSPYVEDNDEPIDDACCRVPLLDVVGTSPLRRFDFCAPRGNPAPNVRMLSLELRQLIATDQPHCSQGPSSELVLAEEQLGCSFIRNIRARQVHEPRRQLWRRSEISRHATRETRLGRACSDPVDLGHGASAEYRRRVVVLPPLP